MTGLNINTSNEQIANPQFRSGKNVSKPVETEDRKSLSKSAKLAISTTLAALAATGIYIATTKGKSKQRI